MFLLLCIQAQQAPTKVFLVAGQSNTDGRVDNTNLPTYIKDNGFRHCWLSYGSGSLSGKGLFQRFQPWVAKDGGAERWGYDAVLYYLIGQDTTDDFYIIKESLGGTAIDLSCNSNNGMYWSADREFLSSTTAADKGGKSLLKAFTENIGACIDNYLSRLENGFEIKAFLWHQGESDKDAAANYRENIKCIVQFVREYLVRKTGNRKYEELPFICGTFSLKSRDYNQQIVDALYDLELEDANFHVVDISDGSLQPDQLHFDAKGAELLGRRMYDRLKSLSTFSLRSGQRVTIDCDTLDAEPVIKSALRMLTGDIRNVLSSDVCIVPKANIVVSQDASLFKGKNEAFRLEVKGGKLYVTGSDAHGVAYGLLEVSRLMGVSPWEWWADATPEQRQSFSLPDGFVSEQAPDVAFRGVFINDEDWGLMPWASLTYELGVKGQIGPKTNARIFELLLRLRANTYWPAMHECTHPFFLTDGNREVASQYGIYIGGSHCEPMASSTAGEWPRRGQGDYDYVNNREHVYQFWEERVKDVANQPILYTIGMRGVHDGAMQGAKTVEEQKAVLCRVFDDQRQLLSRYVNPDVRKVPQVFIPYKEVLDVYNAGLQVPEDVCLMWTDDNYGYIRHFPTEAEKSRSGGNGIYYHVSYWGRPHDYLWLGTFSPALLYQQMTTAYDRGIRKIWILNVGDIKPCEYQMELFMDMAWNMDAVRQTGIYQHLCHFLQREFGDEIGKNLLPVMREHYRLAYIHKPEFMGGTRTEESDRQYWNTIRDLPLSEGDINQRLHDYQTIEDEVERIGLQIPTVKKDTYFQLVKYPVQATAEMNKKLLYGQKARHGMEEWKKSDAAYDSIASLTLAYNTLNKGKWQRMMDGNPRRLPVFEPVPHEQATHSTFIDTPYLYKWNGTDCVDGNYSPCEGLGYEGKAVWLGKEGFLTYLFKSIQTDSIEVEVRLVPTHPLEGTTLRFNIVLDGNEPVAADYATQGRSEEWKTNVLWNQAVRRFKLPVKEKDSCRLTLTALDEGIVVDQVIVKKSSKR